MREGVFRCAHFSWDKEAALEMQASVVFTTREVQMPMHSMPQSHLRGQLGVAFIACAVVMNR